jgi:hypothetical protein
MKRIKRQLTLSAIAVLILATGGWLIAFVTARASTAAPDGGAQREAAAISQCQGLAGSSLAARGNPPSDQLQGQMAIINAGVHRDAATLAAAAKPPVPASGRPGMLDERHRYALGMIETGNHDGEIGGAGEVSRYQIMPSVWQRYSDSRDYHDPDVSLEVAQQFWTALYNDFKRRAHREPTDFDMYVLWNTHYGYYASRGFDPARLGPVVRGRAQRYVNLVEDGM